MKHSELRHQPRHVNPRIQDKSKIADGLLIMVEIAIKMFRISQLFC